MKKHLLGFALFSLIVGTAIFVVALMYNPSQTDTNPIYEVSTYSCRHSVRQNKGIRRGIENSQTSVKITQAVLNERTNKLNMDFSIQRETPSIQDVKIKLTFVNGVAKESNNWDGVVRTESVTLSPNFNVDNLAVYSMPASYEWLGNLKTNENLYVKAEIENSNSNKLENISRTLDFNEFTPVLMVTKKRNF